MSTMTLPSADTSLRKLCFLAVRKHFHILGTGGILSLPTAVIKDLLPYLTICQLEEVQPAVNLRGISTYSEWLTILKNLWGVDSTIKFLTEEEAKQGVMTLLFPLVLYGYRNHYILKNRANLNVSFLRTASKYVEHFSCMSQSLHFPKVFQSVTCGQQPLLNIFEKHVKSVTLTDSMDLSKEGIQQSLYIIHRLFDHGTATKLNINVPNPTVLGWLLLRRGTAYENPELKKLMDKARASQVTSTSADGAESSSGFTSRSSDCRDFEGVPCKRSKSDSCFQGDSVKLGFSVEPEVLCVKFGQCNGDAGGPCPRGGIESLKIRLSETDSLGVLVSALPTFFSLRSLSLHKSLKFSKSDMLELARGMRGLSDSSRGQLTELNICGLPDTKLIGNLLDASNTLTSLTVEVQNTIWRQEMILDLIGQVMTDKTTPWPLKNLTLKVNEFQSNLNFITYALKRCPSLSSLHLAGLRLPSTYSLKPLFSTIKESNRTLKILTLEDLKLCDCLYELMNLLQDCKLEELHLNDCRLLEMTTNKEHTLLQLVYALKNIPTLRKLSLAQNRLAKEVCVLHELFTGTPLCSLEQLNLSSNFIQPFELLEFAKQIKAHRIRQKMILDLRQNPADRDRDTWEAALEILRSAAIILYTGWKSMKMMSDHLGNV